MSSALKSPRAPGPTGPSLIAAGLGLGMLGLLVWLHALLLAPFVLSLALAYVLEPIVGRLLKARVPRVLAVVLCVSGAVILALLLLLLLVPIALELAPMLRQQLPELAGRGWHALVPWLTQIGVKVPHDLGDLRPILIKLMDHHGEQWARAAINSLMVGGSAMLTLAGLAVLVPMLAFYWLLDWARLTGLARDLVPLRWRPGMDDFLSEADEMLGHYLRGQILVMLILAGYYSVALMLFGFDLAWPIGVFTGLAVFIPYLGFGLGLALAMLAGVLQFSVGASGTPWWPVIAVAGVYGLGQLIESMLLTPRLVGERIGLHPVGVIFVLMLFGQWLGFVGVLMALPVSALLMVILRRGVQRYRRSQLYLSQA